MSTELAKDVLVQGHSGWGHTICRGLGPLAVCIGGSLFFCGEDFSIAADLIFYGGIIFTILFEIWNFTLKRSQVWITDLGTGFIVRDKDGSTEYQDNEITALSLWSVKDYSDGTLKAIDQHAILWVIGREKPLPLEYRFSDKLPDILGSFLDRTFENLLNQANNLIEQGKQVTGEGWAISASGFAYGTTSDQLLRFDQIDAVDIFGDDVCIWRNGEDHASVKFPVKSKNSYILLRVLASKLPERTEDTNQPKTGLGRILFERKSTSSVWAAIILLILGIGGIALLMVQQNFAWVSLFPLLFILCGLIYWHGKATNFRCHERGVYQSGMFSEKTLPYLEVEFFKYYSVRNYVNGGYTGTNVDMQFIPFANSTGKTISYSTTVTGADEDLDVLRDHISDVIAYSMGDRFAQGLTVPWTKNLTFSQEGIYYRPAGFVGRKEEQLLKWEELQTYDVQEGFFHLWKIGSEKSIFNESIGEPNFFPGFFLLSRLTAPPQEDTQAGSTEETTELSDVDAYPSE